MTAARSTVEDQAGDVGHETASAKEIVAAGADLCACDRDGSSAAVSALSLMVSVSTPDSPSMLTALTIPLTTPVEPGVPHVENYRSRSRRADSPAIPT